MVNPAKAPAIRAILKRPWRRLRACAIGCSNSRRHKATRASAEMLDASLGINRVNRNRASKDNSRVSQDSRVSKENLDSRVSLDNKGNRDNKGSRGNPDRQGSRANRARRDKVKRRANRRADPKAQMFQVVWDQPMDRSAAHTEAVTAAVR